MRTDRSGDSYHNMNNTSNQTLQASEVQTHRFTVETARLIGQRSLKDVVNPRGFCLVLHLVLSGDGGAVVLQASVLLLLLLLLLQDVSHCVQQVVQELVGVLLHVVIKQICRGHGTRRGVTRLYLPHMCKRKIGEEYTPEDI